MKKLITLILILSLVVFGALYTVGCKQPESNETIEVVSEPEGEAMKNIETAVLGGGCFWSMEAIFSQLKGVVDAEVGYAGGFKEKYSSMCMILQL